MYVCPECSEEIPDKVKKRSDECPFCHTPWPPDEVDEPEPEAAAEDARPDGWGDEFKPSDSPAASSAAHHEEPEKKSKLGLIIVILVLVLGGGGAGVYFGVIKKGDKGGKGGGKSGPAKFSDDELAAMQRWYTKAHKIIFSYMEGTCRAYHNVNYQYYSYLVPKKSTVKEGGKNVEKVTFVLEVKQKPGAKPAGKIDLFGCPAKLARLHRDHPFVIEAKVWERRQVFGAVLKIADIEIKGKLTGYLKQKKYRSLASQTHKGFAWSGLKKAKDPGLQALSTPRYFKMASDIKSFRHANLTWQKVAPGKYIIGTWRLELKNDEIKKKVNDWAMACETIKRRRIGKLDRPKPGMATADKMVKAGKEVVKDLCNGLVKISRSLEPWKEADVNAAATLLENAKTKWNNEVHKLLVDSAKKLDTPTRAKPF